MGEGNREAIYRELHGGQLARDEEQNRESALRILGLVFKYIRPLSMLDVGCGLGTWLRVALNLGVSEVRGIEGAWLDPSLLRIDHSRVTTLDLEQGFNLGQRFDLVVCLEVAEHLLESAANLLVASLTAHADLVLFSAAIPNQGGHHHVNEQFPGYWASRFAKHEFAVIDLIRPRVWGDPAIHWWLRQNTLLFAHERVLVANPSLAAERAVVRSLDVVHPEVYMAQIRNAGGV